ncbi:MAG: glucoamylase family protein [Sporichthyaceae bacterium]
MNRTLRYAVCVAATGAVATTLVLPSGSATAAGSKDSILRTYTADTWRSMAAMADPGTGLVSDHIGGDLSPATRAEYTSPTNIGAYIWSAVAARKTGLITAADEVSRVQKTLTTLQRLEIHEPSGMFYNWYDPKTGAKLTAWPEENKDGGHDTVYPFLSSVDNGWLATALIIVKDQMPTLAAQADTVLTKMDFGYYYDPAERQIRGGFWKDPPAECSVPGNYRGGATVYYTCHHYGAFNTEPRMASYLGIAAEQIEPLHYFGTYRTFPGDNCDWSWTEQRGQGVYRTYLGQRVFEGSYGYRGMRFVPTWGGSMFEALMVPLFVPEEKWGTKSWAITHPTYVQAQIEHGKEEAGYGYWGFSPASDPRGGYREYGVDQLGMNPDGYTSDHQRTTVDEGYAGCPDRPAQPAPTSYGEGEVTPHASFLALRYARGPAMANLAKLRRNFDAYGTGGFYDTVNVKTGQVAKRYLSLDQGMVMAALGNVLGGDVLRHAFAQGPMEQRVAPLMRMEEFSLTPTGTP